MTTPSLPIPTPTPKIEFVYLGKGKSPIIDYAPEIKTLKVGGNAQTVIKGIRVEVTLNGFKRINPNSPQDIETEFTIRNLGDEHLIFLSKEIFDGSNEGPMQYQLGGAALLRTEKEISIPAKSESTILLTWDTQLDFGGVWITINAPITRAKTIKLTQDTVLFRIELPK